MKKLLVKKNKNNQHHPHFLKQKPSDKKYEHNEMKWCLVMVKKLLYRSCSGAYIEGAAGDGGVPGGKDGVVCLLCLTSGVLEELPLGCTCSATLVCKDKFK